MTGVQTCALPIFQVGKMATMLYPDGIEITEKSNEQALRRTQDLMQASVDVVLFEPAFAFGNLLVRVDILVKRGQRIELIEVKAKSYNSVNPVIAGPNTPILSGMRPYIEDVAFQRYVVSNALPNTDIQCFLMMPDKSVSATVDGLNQCFKIRKLERSTEVIVSAGAQDAISMNAGLLAKVCIDEFVDIVLGNPLRYPGSQEGPQDRLQDVVTRWAHAYETDEKIPPTLTKVCTGCEFRDHRQIDLKSGYHECLNEAAGLSFDEVERGTVLDLWNYRKKDALLDRGVIRMSQIHEDDIEVKDGEEGLSHSQRQWLQVRGILPAEDQGGFYFDAAWFASQMRTWRYPFHMIDFETCTVALPFFAGMRPYESIAFQFSHHIVHADGRIEHKDQALFAKPDRKSTRLNSSHVSESRMPSSA